MNRPVRGKVEERTAPAVAPTIDGKRLRGLIPYGVESRDMGGWREIVDAGALDGADLSDLIATREHDRAHLLGRYPTTLTTEDRADGFAWAVELPESPVGEDVRVAVSRGDLRASSWRQVVAEDRWEGDVRHVTQISHLLDVTVTAAAAYGDAAPAELRAQPDPANGQEDTTMAETASTTEETRAAPEERPTAPTGGLRVEARVTAEPPRTLADEFRAAGWPGEVATIPWQTYEDRAVTWTPSMDLLNQPQRTAGAFPYDQRWAWPALGRIPVDAAATSVLVLSQTARSLATAANVVRAVDAVTAKPETGSTLNLLTVPLKQVATIQSAIPNIVLEQPAVNTVIENDLRLAINDGLDKLLLDTLTASGFQTPGTNLVLSVRSAMTTLYAAGYNPDTLILTPAAAEALDVLVSGIASGTADFVFSPGQFAPNIWQLNRRMSKSVPASVVMDSSAYGKMYMSPVSLARFENASGTTNTGNVRLELNACCGVERQAAAIRIAAS